MFFALLAALGSGTVPAPALDSMARFVTTAPEDSLRVTVVGPAGGPAVVIIPGLVSSAYAYREVLPPLADAGLRVFVIEPLGVGSSSRPGGQTDYSIAAQAGRIAAVMDTLGIAHAVVAGHAVGATMALRLALERPDLVGRVLLMEVGSLATAAVPGVKQALRFSLLVRLFTGRGRIRKELRKGLVASSVDSAWVTDSLIERYTEGAAGNMGAVLRALKRMDRSVEPDSLVAATGGGAGAGAPAGGWRPAHRRRPESRTGPDPPAERAAPVRRRHDPGRGHALPRGAARGGGRGAAPRGRGERAMNRDALELLVRTIQPRRGQAWHGGVTPGGALRNVTAAEARRLPAGGGHSIWELALHLAYWKYAVRRKLEPARPEDSPAARPTGRGCRPGPTRPPGKPIGRCWWRSTRAWCGSRRPFPRPGWGGGPRAGRSGPMVT